MDRKMRRFRQQLPEKDAIGILESASAGVLSLIDSDGLPYGVPLSYAFDGKDSIYFHSALSGHKIECLTANPSCSFCIIDQNEVHPEEFTTYFRSVIARGTIHRVTDPDEINHGLNLLCDKYSPGIDATTEINKFIKNVAVLRLDITGITGKEAIELTRQRPKTAPDSTAQLP